MFVVNPVLDIIAVEVSNSHHGDFLKTFAKAWQLAQGSNKILLKPAWIALIDKYELQDEYAEAIKEHLPEYLERL